MNILKNRAKAASAASFAFAVCMSLSLGACSCKKQAADNLPKIDAAAAMGQIETITGTVAVHDNGGNPQVLIEVKRDTRSKISYEVIGARKDAVAALNGRRVTATGMVRNVSPFHKLIDVNKIEK